MGRELRRVPLDFDYPLHKVWYGYYIDIISTCRSTSDISRCEQCRKMAVIKGLPKTDYGCPDFDTYLTEPMNRLKELLAPPTGDGISYGKLQQRVALYLRFLRHWTSYANGARVMRLPLRISKPQKKSGKKCFVMVLFFKKMEIVYLFNMILDGV